jgi:glutamine amidotransferase
MNLFLKIKVISATTDYSSKIVCSVEKKIYLEHNFTQKKVTKMDLKIIDNFINL